MAHPEGYEVMRDVEETAVKNAKESGGSFIKTNSMAEAFADADIVSKELGTHLAMEKRTKLYEKGDLDGIKALERASGSKRQL